MWTFIFSQAPARRLKTAPFSVRSVTKLLSFTCGWPLWEIDKKSRQEAKKYGGYIFLLFYLASLWAIWKNWGTSGKDRQVIALLLYVKTIWRCTLRSSYTTENEHKQYVSCCCTHRTKLPIKWTAMSSNTQELSRQQGVVTSPRPFVQSDRLLPACLGTAEWQIEGQRSYGSRRRWAWISDKLRDVKMEGTIRGQRQKARKTASK